MIRQFSSQDAPSCYNLIHNCISEDSSLSVAVRRKLLESETPQSMEERARLFYVAVHESESRITGLAGLDLNEIRLMYVSPEHRRSGIGRALLGHIAAMAPKDFFKDLFVYSSIAAVDFYRSQGFVVKGSVSFDISGETMRTIFMACLSNSLPLQSQLQFHPLNKTK